MSTSAPFEYLVAGSWDEAVGRLVSLGEDAKVLAGGQSLGPMLNLRLAMPETLIDINPIPAPGPALDDEDENVLVISAMTRHRTILRDPLVGEHCPLLAKAAAHIGNVRVRTRGTVGGSLAHADPTGEVPCTVLALGGRIVARGPAGDRAIAADDFFDGYLTTTLADDELVTEVRLPVLGPRDGWAFQEAVRRASDFAMVSVAAVVRRAGDGPEITAARVVAGGVAGRPLLFDGDGVGDVLAPLIGGTGTPEETKAVATAITERVSPESDVHASGAYRKHLTAIMVRRTLTEAIAR